ncbi:GMC family oxidoreductase N-terminal domain-containing protein [Streptomyces sp. ISL-12]|uniref:GMC family oxidoreductase N-terminal domain-containing protein n=1 Tax=Streptomyces sp. ISL-12 TaxID=2819177 RepID=UPI001BE542D7|nr:GMC family oxidoreductase N-terminal domain-containing protein [Streptomyces sp. ISL-12]MBT2412754.1 GMC family oxidoreductase N-terminal domain-containing protein [Streptomyces sp. ISL-12]
MPLAVHPTPRQRPRLERHRRRPRPAAHDPRGEIADRCLCLRVVLDAGTVTGVTVRDLADGGERTVTVRAVVVAADALRTPQLLHASGIRPPARRRHRPPRRHRPHP